MCPTCRHRTDFDNIAYADERENVGADENLQTERTLESSIEVNGSYGTKVTSEVPSFW